MQLLQLLHEVVLGVQPTRRIHKKIRDLARLRGGHGVVGYRRGISPISASDNFDVETLTPKLDLFDRRGPECIASGKEHTLTTGLNKFGELGGGRGFPSAVNSDDGHDSWTVSVYGGVEFGIISGKALLHLALRDGKYIQAAAALRFVAFLDRIHDLRCHRHAQIGAEQRRLKFLERVCFQFGGPGNDPLNLVRELRVGLLQTDFEFGE